METENITRLLQKHKQNQKTDSYLNTKNTSQFSYIKLNYDIDLPWEIIYFYSHFNIEDDVINSILYNNFRSIKIFYNKIFIEYCVEKWITQINEDDTENSLENILEEASYNFNLKNNAFEGGKDENFMQKCFIELNSDSDFCFSIGLDVTSDCGGTVYFLINGEKSGHLTTDFGHEQINHGGMQLYYSPLEEKNTWHCLKMYEELIINSLK